MPCLYAHVHTSSYLSAYFIIFHNANSKTQHYYKVLVYHCVSSHLYFEDYLKNLHS
jgi:hypothetical protein